MRKSQKFRSRRIYERRHGEPLLRRLLLFITSLYLMDTSYLNNVIISGLICFLSTKFLHMIQKGAMPTPIGFAP